MRIGLTPTSGAARVVNRHDLDFQMIIQEISEFDFQEVEQIQGLIQQCKSLKFVSDKAASHSYTNHMPSGGFSGLIDRNTSLYKLYNNFEMSEVCLFKTEDAYLFVKNGGIILPGGLLLSEASAEAKWVLSDWKNLPYTIQRNDHLLFVPPPGVPEISAAFSCMPVGAVANYGHFMTDALTSACKFRDFIIENKLPILTPPLRPWQRRGFELIGLANQVIETNDELIIVRCLFHSNISNHFLHKMTYDVSRAAKMQAKHITPILPQQTHELIFVSRAGHPLRPYPQEQELQNQLENIGFTAISPEKLTVDDQIYQFSKARVIVGMTGAGLTNVAYCQPESLTIEIMPRSWRGNVWVRNLTYVTGGYWLPMEVPEVEVEAGSSDLRYDPDFDVTSLVNEIRAATDQL